MQDLLSRTKLADIVKPDQKIVLLEHNATVGDALKTLAQHHILSAPMIIEPDIEEVQGGSLSGPQLLGWIDVADVLRAFLQRESQGGQLLRAHPPTSPLGCLNACPSPGRRPARRGACAAHPDAGADEAS